MERLREFLSLPLLSPVEVVVRRSRRMVDRARVGGSLGTLVLMSESTGARNRLQKRGVSDMLGKQYGQGRKLEGRVQ